GAGASYLLLGPVDLAEIADVATEADLIVSADVGRPASRMGDINGDGLADLVFIRPVVRPNLPDRVVPDQFVLTVIMGRIGGGLNGDRHADFVALTTLVADQTNRRNEAAALLRDGGGDARLPGGPPIDPNALSSRAETSPGLRAIAAGDVNGDGLDDLLLA